jgi:hypothetical protein
MFAINKRKFSNLMWTRTILILFLALTAVLAKTQLSAQGPQTCNNGQILVRDSSARNLAVCCPGINRRLWGLRPEHRSKVRVVVRPRVIVHRRPVVRIGYHPRVRIGYHPRVRIGYHPRTRVVVRRRRWRRLVGCKLAN